jgi:hypothetical protein
MVALRELAKQIETPQEADSKAGELKGKNVRGPSLIAEQMYLGKSWKPTTEGSDNRFLALRFKGCAHKDKDGQRTPLAENPRLIDLKPGDVYLFERHTEGRITEFEAFGNDDCLCFGDPPVRLTFFEIAGVTQQTKPEKAARKTAKASAAGRKTTSRRKGAEPEEERESVDETEAANSEGKDDAAEEVEAADAAGEKIDRDAVDDDNHKAAKDKDDGAKADAKDEVRAEEREPAHNR